MSRATGPHGPHGPHGPRTFQHSSVKGQLPTRIAMFSWVLPRGILWNFDLHFEWINTWLPNAAQNLYQEVTEILQVQIPAGSEGIDVTRARGWQAEYKARTRGDTSSADMGVVRGSEKPHRLNSLSLYYNLSQVKAPDLSNTWMTQSQWLFVSYIYIYSTVLYIYTL